MGSRKMKLVTVGLALASVAQALDCINDPVDLSGDDLANWCDANASKCKDFDVDPCYDPYAEDVLEPRSTTMDDAEETEDASHDMSNKIRPKSGVELGTEVEVSRTWVDDVEEYCRTNKKACRYHWGLKVARKLLNFKDQMDNVFKQEATEHYNEFMSFANDRCFKRIQQCHSEIKSVGSVEIPSYENFWNFSCMECFVMSMRLIKLHAGDVSLANMDDSNCLGKFCRAIKEKRQHLAALEKEHKGVKNNALSADFASFQKWRDTKKGQKKLVIV